MKKEKRIDWHGIVQELLDEHLPLMSGKQIQKITREKTHYYKVDYYCEVTGELPQKPKSAIKPFNHLKKKNIIEYKSMHEVLNEGMFRQYLARVLFMENPKREESYQGEMSLTILTTHTPKAVLGNKHYEFKEIYPWKYESRFFPDLDIYILVQREIKKSQEESLALLQVLEGEKERQRKIWQNLYNQNLENIKSLERVMNQINEEVFMKLAEKYKEIGRKEGEQKGEQKGKIEGKIEELLKVLSWIAPELVKKYQKTIQEAKTEKELKAIEAKIQKELTQHPKTKKKNP